MGESARLAYNNPRLAFRVGFGTDYEMLYVGRFELSHMHN